jgi:hypothetical protein
MAQDRYLKSVLTVIAAALVYLCAVLTPWPGAAAQTQPPLVRPGDYTGPIPVVVAGWRAPEIVPVGVSNAVQVTGAVRVTGAVTTERTSGAADRVVIVGWEEDGAPDRRGKEFRGFDSTTPRPGLPTTPVPR